MRTRVQQCWDGFAWACFTGGIFGLIVLACSGCSIQGGTKKGGGWLLEWQPPKVEIDNGGRPLLIDFGRVMWADWPAPEANPVEPSPQKT